MAIQTCNSLPEIITVTAGTVGLDANDFYTIARVDT